MGFEQPFEMLHACHERVERIVRLLVKIREHVKTHGAAAQARDAARDVMRYFDQAGPHHHKDEERHVFPPLLAQRDPAVLAVVIRLKQDHQAMAVMWAQVRAALSALVEAGDRRGRAHGRARGVAQVGEVEGDALGAEHHVGLVEQLGEAVAAVGEQLAGRQAIVEGGDGELDEAERDRLEGRELAGVAGGVGLGPAMTVLRTLFGTRSRMALRASSRESSHRAMPPDDPASWTILPGFFLAAEELAVASGIGLEEVQAVLQAFTHFGNNSTFADVSAFNADSATPLIPLPDGRVLLFQYYSLVEALYESPFYWMSQDDSYKNTAAKHRGEFTETIAGRCLAKVFGAGNVRSNVSIFSGKHRFGEVDVLVTFGDRLVIVQAKSQETDIGSQKGKRWSNQSRLPEGCRTMPTIKA